MQRVIPKIWLKIHETRIGIAEIPEIRPESLNIRPKTLGILRMLQILEIPENRLEILKTLKSDLKSTVQA